MLKLYVTNVMVKASDPEANGVLYSALAYKAKGWEQIVKRAPKGSYTARWDGTKSFYDQKKRVFLTGLLPRVKAQLAAMGVPYEIVDMRTRPEVSFSDGCFDLKGIEFWDYQKRTIKEFIVAGRGVAQLATGAGKTECAIAITKGLALPTLFLTHRVNLLNQTAKRFIARCPEAKNHIGILGAGTYEPKAITIATVQTLMAFIKKNQAGARAFLEQFKFLIEDEAHRGGAKQFYLPAMLCKNAYYRLALTATPFMAGDPESDMYLLGTAGEVVTRVTNGELIERGILARPFFKYFHISSPDMSHGRMKWRDVYERGIIYNALRNNIIATQARKLSDKGKKILVIVMETAHGRLLEGLIKEQGVRVKYVDGKNATAEREKALSDITKNKLDCIIATNIFDEGIDVNDINAIILGAGLKSPPALFQRTGRATRKKVEDNYAIIIDFVDDTHPNLAEHSRQRYELVKNEPGFTIL